MLKKWFLSLAIAGSALLSGLAGQAEASASVPPAAAPPVVKGGELTSPADFKSPPDALPESRKPLEAPLSLDKAARGQGLTVNVNAALNNNPNNAIQVVTGAVYADKITEEGGQRWYVFQTNNPGKLTAYLQTIPSASIDYDLHLFRYDPATSSLVEQETSSYGPQSNEQISRIAPAGIYFLAVSAYTGFDANTSYYFTVVESPSYDAAEPDDNIWHAQQKTDSFTVSGRTIDNSLDVDWIKYTVTAAKSFHIKLANSAPGTTYQLQIFNQNLGSLGTVDQNKDVDASLTPGTYYLRVVSLNSFNATVPYSLTFSEYKAPASVEIVSIKSEPNIDSGERINYGRGDKWRIQNYMTVTGIARDASGAPAYNASVSVFIEALRNNQLYSGTAVTDSNGRFTLTINGIQAASGRYAYSGYVSTHYYDIIPMWVYSGGTQLNANDNSLYHFAYSIYNPH
ncbi:Ig-like domain-containing protein [Paenibacillus chitinolyticus]|uniref:carboxypeptidase-like regulatory domain-containing protein n=1 Tax=Paenibacillus chitinolyticus TaxID=79263 RepID=UPI003D03A3DE